MLIPVNFGKMLVACSDPPRAVRETPAFVHRTTGDVLLVRDSDEAAEKWFPGVPLGKLLAALSQAPDWLAVAKHSGRVIDLGAFVREWCEANGFIADG